MKSEIGELIRNHRLKGILIDSNILLLHVIGMTDPTLVPRFKRTKQFTIDDFDLLQRLLACFSCRVTTPNVLTEVSNLASQLNEPARQICLNRLSEDIQTLDERYERSSEIAGNEDFSKIGLTDTGIKRIAHKQLLVLTDDYRLANRLSSLGTAVLNFNHIRSFQ